MDNQPLAGREPAPLKDDTVQPIACVHCKFSRSVRLNPTDLQTQRICKLFPPQNIITYTNQGPMIAGSASQFVSDFTWCFQFSAITDAERVEGDTAPKLLEMNGKSILNG